VGEARMRAARGTHDPASSTAATRAAAAGQDAHPI